MSTVQTTLYEADFNLWLEKQALALRQGRFEDLDIENLVEEIESLSRSDKRALRSYLRVLLLHLLKWQYQPSHHSRSWQASVYNCRQEIQELLVDSPSLKPYITEVLETCYQNARVNAVTETGLTLATFPKQCPFSLEEVLSIDFLAEESSQ
jgi:predicted DNA-binding ribbon-helix-helix protein